MSTNSKLKMADVQTKSGENWFYTDEVKEHFFQPQNLLRSKEEEKKFGANGVGEVGSPACGDMMKIWVKINPKTEKIKGCKWQTFGCASAIASTSMLSVMVTEKGGMKINDALKIKPQEIVKRLVDLPPRKFHCSVLGDKALREAINDYFEKSGQYDRVVRIGAKIIDKQVNVTDKDIEEAVLEGAFTFEAVQKKTKIGIQDKTCIPEAERLIKFYKEKFFGDKD